MYIYIYIYIYVMYICVYIYIYIYLCLSRLGVLASLATWSAFRKVSLSQDLWCTDT